jgi:hypothetical protein
VELLCQLYFVWNEWVRWFEGLTRVFVEKRKNNNKSGFVIPVGLGDV